LIDEIAALEFIAAKKVVYFGKVNIERTKRWIHKAHGIQMEDTMNQQNQFTKLQEVLY
jgi:hypothetical protein